MRTPPETSNGPSSDARTVGACCGCIASVVPTRRTRRAPDGQRPTAASTSSALAASTWTHGRRPSSKTCGSERTQFWEWEQRRGSHSTTISSVAYSFVSLSRFELISPRSLTLAARAEAAAVWSLADGCCKHSGRLSLCPRAVRLRVVQAPREGGSDEVHVADPPGRCTDATLAGRVGAPFGGRAAGGLQRLPRGHGDTRSNP